MYCDDLHCWKLSEDCKGSHGGGRGQPSSLPPEGRYLDYITYCHDHVPGWKALPKESLVLNVLSGGLSNELFLCSAVTEDKSVEIEKVVVRIYGPAMSVLVDGTQERAISRALSKNGLGPTIYYEFEDQCGRIEQFLKGDTLSHFLLREEDVVRTIARYLAKFHAQDLNIENMPKESQVFVRMRKWLKLAASAMKNDSPWLGPARIDRRASLLKEMNFDEDVIETEISWLEKYLSQFKSPVVFCHNDLQEGNVIRDKETGKLQVIDFEYGCYCERAFDLGNFFCEWIIDNQHKEQPCFKLDHQYFPTLEQRLSVSRDYLGEKATEGEVAKVEREVYCFMLASHLQWVIWGVLQAFTPQVETNKFDYIQYAYERWNAYLRHKATLDTLPPL